MKKEAKFAWNKQKNTGWIIFTAKRLLPIGGSAYGIPRKLQNGTCGSRIAFLIKPWNVPAGAITKQELLSTLDEQTKVQFSEQIINF